MTEKKTCLEWRVHTARLLSEILNNNPNMEIFNVPLKIFANLLCEVGERAAQLNDPVLNALMCRLTIYEIADPYSPEYNREEVEQILKNVKDKEKYVL
jgi:hypothetical protein